ncbi:alpha-amylase family glycosyl hydrolase [Curvibacter gracilis]|uniref:alpha-amylase family glycosyl hydrolase n=1 Tax=Curvibacter gracilis TaxID=230310 RepID=UPI00068800F0|nr:alpha-amylase family glycosyl hydrolase [Curvibacter gracilis]
MNFVGACPPPQASESVSPSVSDFLQSIPPARATRLRERLERELPRLRRCLDPLYGQTPCFDSFFDTVVLNALASAERRDAELWQLDLRREADPAWHQRGLSGYCTYVDKLAGTLAGVQQRIGYLRELGVNYLHLLPFLKAGSAPNDGGFAVASFDEVEPALGTLADLRSLCRALRQSDISLCSDFVLNHVSHEHAWARAARAGDPRYLPYFHWLASEAEVQAREQHLVQIFPATAPGNFTWIAERQAWVWTTFYPYQWDLNYAHPAVFADMAAALLNLANQGVDAFRLDSTGFLWKRAETNCMNQPEVHLIVQALRSLCAIAAPGVLLKAEAIMPTQDLPPYFGLGPVAGPECHLAYHSSLMAASWVALTEESPQLIEEVLRNTPELPVGASWLSYVRCHDDIGWNVLRPELLALGADPVARLDRAAAFLAGETPGSYARGARFQASAPGTVHGSNGMTAALVGLRPDLPADHPEQQKALRRLELMMSLCFFVGGLPLIYMGDELGQDNTSAAEMHARQGADGRELHRPYLDEKSLASRHQAATVAAHAFSLLQRLNRQRRARLSLGGPIRLQVLASRHPGLLVLQRNQEVGLFNFSATPCRLHLSELGKPALQNLSQEESQTVASVHLEGHGCVWLGA